MPPPNPPQVHCSNCYFWERIHDEVGVCHRYPPPYNALNDEASIPHSQYWCGDGVAISTH